MNLQTTINIMAGGMGSGCHGNNCGRKVVDDLGDKHGGWNGESLTLKSPEVLYHATSKPHSAKKYGLTPRIPPEVLEDEDLSNEDKESTKGIYLTDKDSAHSYAEGRLEGKSKVLKVTLPEGTKIFRDPVDHEAVYVKNKVNPIQLEDE